MIVGSEMIERMKVAALCAYIENGGRADIGEHLTHGDMRHVAPDMIGKMMTAALKALMEPTEAMMQAGQAASSGWLDTGEVGPVWQSMIRAALEEGS